MSVALVITDTIDKLYVPVATEQFFRAYWQPKSLEAGMIYVPAFATGIDVNATNVGVILSELHALTPRISGYADVPDDVKIFWLKRLHDLIYALEERKSGPKFDAFIG